MATMPNGAIPFVAPVDLSLDHHPAELELDYGRLRRPASWDRRSVTAVLPMGPRISLS
jgi:hypothetical protein